MNTLMLHRIENKAHSRYDSGKYERRAVRRLLDREVRRRTKLSPKAVSKVAA